MIRFAESHELEKIAQYAFRLNSIKEHKCKAFPSDYEKILAQFMAMNKHPNDQILVATDGRNILGVLALTIEKEELYMEATGGVFCRK